MLFHSDPKILADAFTAVRFEFPDLWLGVGASSLSAVQAFRWVAESCSTADAVWLHKVPCLPAEVSWDTLDAKDFAIRVDRWLTAVDQPELQMAKRARQKCG